MTCLTTPSSQVANEDQYFRTQSIHPFPRVITVLFLYCTLPAHEFESSFLFYNRVGKSSLVDATASFASCLMNVPCNAAMLILRPSFVPSLTISST